MRYLIFLFVLSINSVSAATLIEILEKANRYTVKIENSIEKPFMGDGYGGSGTGFLVNKEKK